VVRLEMVSQSDRVIKTLCSIMLLTISRYFPLQIQCMNHKYVLIMVPVFKKQQGMIKNLEKHLWAIDK